MKSASLTSAACAGCLEMTQPSGRFHRWTCRCPKVVFAGSARSKSVRCRFVAARVVNELLPGRRVAYAAEELLYLDEFGLRYLLSSLS